MDIIKKLGITPEEFLNGFQNYLKSLPDNDEDNRVDLSPTGKTILRTNSSLTVGESKTESHYKNYINLLISQKRDSKIDEILKK